jgi:GAF domain-containing protein
MKFDNFKPEVTAIYLKKILLQETRNLCQFLSDSVVITTVGFTCQSRSQNIASWTLLVQKLIILCNPFGKGICGQVQRIEPKFVVPDVAAQDNYIACSLL